MFFRKLAARVAADVRSALGADRIVLIDERANCFGVESKGVLQVRGNGCLAATTDEVFFLMWAPRKEMRIPRGRITTIERTRWHLGKSKGRELLRVRFTNDAGAPDSVAWWVADLPAWEAILGSPAVTGAEEQRDRE